MLAMLAALGAGFDCASVMELEAAQELGVPQERIIFANPCKKPADFRCGPPLSVASHLCPASIGMLPAVNRALLVALTCLALSVLTLVILLGWVCCALRRYAVAHGVQKTTFDTPSELHKIAQLNPRFKCVLRIRCDDPTAKCPLGEWHSHQPCLHLQQHAESSAC
jgi:hypothetical protein